MANHHIIYVPGLGDPNRFERMVISWWSIFAVNTHYFPLVWEDGKLFLPKFESLLNLIDELNKQNNLVSLIGTSAGASAVLNAYAKFPSKINGVVCICGKIQNLQAIGPIYYKRSPAFKKSVELLPARLQSLTIELRKNILSIRPIKDGVVPPSDTKIDGAKLKLIPSFGHAFSIGYALTISSWSIIRFLKSINLPSDLQSRVK